MAEQKIDPKSGDGPESGETRPNMIWALIFAALIAVSIGAAAKRFELQQAKKAVDEPSQSSLVTSAADPVVAETVETLEKVTPQGLGEDHRPEIIAEQTPADLPMDGEASPPIEDLSSRASAPPPEPRGWDLNHSFGSATIPKRSTAENPLETALLPSPEKFRDGPTDKGLLSKAVPITPETSAKLAEKLDSVPFDLAAAREQQIPVPRVSVTTLPGDIAELEDPEARKELFQRILLPLVLINNELIAQDRAKAEDIISRETAGQSLSQADQEWLAQQTENFGATDTTDLLKRLDVLPVGLVMAQGIQESGWGTSRFALEGNALFGQRTWKDDQPGMVPEEIGEGESFRVRKFETLEAAVKSYMHNLNSHASYEDMRQLRSEMAKAGTDGGQPSTEALVPGLLSYSEEGELYVKRLRQLIAENHLSNFDKAVLWPLEDTRTLPATIGEDDRPSDDDDGANEG